MQSSQEKKKTIVMQNFIGDNKVHCGLCENVELKDAMVFEKGVYRLWWEHAHLLVSNTMT